MLKPETLPPHRIPQSWAYWDIATLRPDQGDHNTCVSNAAMELVRAKRGRHYNDWTEWSRAANYGAAKYLFESGDIQDDGLFPADSLSVIQSRGIVAETSFPYTQGNILSFAPSNLWTPVKEFTFQFVDPSNVELMQLALLEHGPMLVGGDWYAEWMSTDADGKLNPNPTSVVGGHERFRIGWQTLRDGIMYWVDINSWGPAWGIDGWYRVQFEHDHLDDAYVAVTGI